MKKLYRSTLVAAVLAFGVAACGDDVQIVDPEPTPPPALQVTLTPSNVNLNVGDNVNLAVGISGGDPAASPSITCESSNTDVVTTSASGSNCAVEAVGSGNATVTATVTKGNQESSAGAAINVTDAADLVPASVSIESIRQHPGGGTVDLDDASGQLDVTMNVRFNDEQPVRLKLYVDDEIVATQEWATAVAALEEGEDPEEVVEQVTLSFKSNYYEIDEDGTAWIRTYNGMREISANLEVATEGAEPRASNTVQVRFNNADGFHVNAMLPDNSAMDGEGRRWYGGWGEDEGAEITAIPVFFSAKSAANVRVALGSTPSGLCPEGAQVGTEAPFQFSFSCSNFESERTDDTWPDGSSHTGELPTITAQYADSGNDVPEVGGSVRILNDDHPFPIRIDNVAPGLNPGVHANTAAIDGVLFIGTQEGLWNRENWINDEYDFSTGLIAAYVDYDEDGMQEQASCAEWILLGEAQPVAGNGGPCDLRLDDEIRDGGSSFEADIDVQFYVSAPGEGLEDAEPVDSPADAAESNTNREYQLHVVLTDALGNERVITQMVNPYAAAAGIERDDMRTAFWFWSHGLNTFGVDRTAPIVEVDNEAALEFGEDYIVQRFADNGSPAVDQYLIYFEAFDEVSGFAHPGAYGAYGDQYAAMLAQPDGDNFWFDAAIAHVFGKVTGDAQTNEPQSEWYFAQGDEDSFVDTPFATSAAGDFIATPVPFLGYSPDDTKLVFDVSLADAGLGNDQDDAGYYIYQMRAQDKAGNRTEVSSIRSYVNAGVNPDASGFNAGGNLIGGQSVTFPGTAEDDVEIFNASFAFQYGTLTEENILGKLVYDRNPEQLTELFDDEILRRADFQHETTFIRSLQLWDNDAGEVSVVAQPSEIETRAYSGYTFSGDDFIHLNADDQEASHLSEFGAGNGFSEYGGASILSTQLQDPGNFDDAELEEWTAAEDNGDLVATARGISGQFSNPFHTVVFVARFDVDGDEYLVPMGAVARGDATQLDSGIYRDYFFTFDLSEFDLPAGVEESQLLGYHAVGLNDGWDGLATGLAEFDQPEDPAEYTVDWTPAENDDESPIELDLGESQTFTVEVLLDGVEAEGEEVTVTSSGLQGTFDYPSPVSFSTDANGEGSFTFTASSTSESSGTITATVAGESVTWYVSVEDMDD